MGIGVVLAGGGRNHRHAHVNDPVDQVGTCGDHGDAVEHHRSLGLHHVLFAIGVELARGKSAAGGQGAKGVLLFGR